MTSQQAMRLSAILGDGEAFYKAPVDGQLVDLGLISVEPDEITVRLSALGRLCINVFQRARQLGFSNCPDLDRLSEAIKAAMLADAQR